MENSPRWLLSISLLLAATILLSFAFATSTPIGKPRSKQQLHQQLKQHQWGLGSIANAEITDLPSVKPVDDQHPLVSGFGMRRHPILQTQKLHAGIDFAAPKGASVYAAAAGVIERISPLSDSSTFGIHVVILHDSSAFFAGRYRTLYAHLSGVSVRKGQKVTAGQMIGKVGSTGRSTAAHLHYEVHFDDQPEDPELYLEEESEILEPYKPDTLLVEEFYIR